MRGPDVDVRENAILGHCSSLARQLIKMLFLFLVSDIPFCLIRRIHEHKNKVGTTILMHIIYCNYLFIKVDNV